jgi:hypothetical protein
MSASAVTDIAHPQQETACQGSSHSVLCRNWFWSLAADMAVS